MTSFKNKKVEEERIQFEIEGPNAEELSVAHSW
jgi:hypothetical protein